MIGLDILGLGSKHWPVKLSMNVIPEGWAIGTFWNTFGDCRPNLIKLLKTGKFPACRVHLWWSDAHKIAPLSVVKDGAIAFEAIAQQFPNIDIYLSHSCEYREKSRSEVEARVGLLMQHAPHCIPVCSPIDGSPTNIAAMTERHNDGFVSKVGELASMDGSEAADIDSAKWIKNTEKAEIQFLWSHRFNLRQQGVNPPPKQRKAAPNRQYFEDIIALASPKGEAPTPSFTATPLKKPSLWKTFAEDKSGNTDSRANKPLLISPSKATKIDVVTFNNKVVCQLAYFGPYSGGGYRHYSGAKGGSKLSASQIAKAAINISGSPWVWFRDGKKFYGPVNSIFRGNYFR